MKKNIALLIFFVFGCNFYLTGQVIPDQLNIQSANKHSHLQAEKDGISFLTIGDFGRHGAFSQKEVARDMGEVGQLIQSNFTISVGDNFYPSGVQSIQDNQWQTSFETIYKHHVLHKPWFVALGNHDYEGNPQAQIDYSQISKRWEMPQRYFEKLIKISQGKYLQLLVIDTNPFISKYRNETDKYKDIALQNTQKQLDWLENKLKGKDPKIAWRIVVGHHPLYTGGKRKNAQETADIQALFEPILEKYKVDAYLCGHEHDLQIIRKKNQHLTQFLSGAGSDLRETGITEGTLFAESVPGFMAFTLTNNTLKAYVIQSEDHNFKVIYQLEIKK